MVTKQSIAKLKLGTSELFEISSNTKCEINISLHYLSRYIKQLYNNSQEWLFLILVVVIINRGDGSIEVPNLKDKLKTWVVFYYSFSLL